MKNISIFSSLSADLLKKRIKEPQPNFVKPMLATLTKDYFSSDEWLYEDKFDGVRCIAVKKKGSVFLYSRNHNLINDEYPEIAQALNKQKADNFIIDGEIVAVNVKGVTDFQLLQGRINLSGAEKVSIKQKNVPVCFCIFDLLYVDGYTICKLPLLVRKALLKKLLTYSSVLLYSNHVVGKGVELFKKACKKHHEGVMAKKSDSQYVSTRSTNWLKFKCSMGQELVIGGYTEPRGTRNFFGALLVGYYKDGELHYAGKVGTGFSHETLSFLGKKLQKLHVKKCPFVGYDLSERGVYWVRPVLVAEFEFAQWTQAGKLRVGRYKGLRKDKAAQSVIREMPQ